MVAGSGESEQIEVIQPLIKSKVVSDLPNTDAHNVITYIETKFMEPYELANAIIDAAKIPNDVAQGVALEVWCMSNWVKEKRTGKYFLVDF